jgi:hypothetical protein
MRFGLPWSPLQNSPKFWDRPLISFPIDSSKFGFILELSGSAGERFKVLEKNWRTWLEPKSFDWEEVRAEMNKSVYLSTTLVD